MTGWLLVLSFLLGLGLTWLYMVRTVRSEVVRSTVSAPVPKPRSAAERYREQVTRNDGGRSRGATAAE
ncbi:channel accessory protein ArfC [Gephyromycinifex aptenodytis]|uniref:channel accessory protein ArfC n=1 Tax=Gephyromycinifex aptenodytis TaxID=2716227 RepID=UPI0014469991|nr:hypothetical protein [Gephyromycinifex aptenodytis]